MFSAHPQPRTCCTPSYFTALTPQGLNLCTTLRIQSPWTVLHISLHHHTQGLTVPLEYMNGPNNLYYKSFSCRPFHIHMCPQTVCGLTRRGWQENLCCNSGVQWAQNVFVCWRERPCSNRLHSGNIMDSYGGVGQLGTSGHDVTQSVVLFTADTDSTVDLVFSWNLHTLIRLCVNYI